MSKPPRQLEKTLSAFADRLFETGGRDPGDSAVALAPARLDIYRDLVRGNYRSMLSFSFTYSLALIDFELRAADGANGLPGDVSAILVRFLQNSPARTHSSREIADRFLAFLLREYPQLFVFRADLRDLLTLERAELRASYHPDDPGRCLDAAEVDAIASGPLDGLLSRTILRAPSASILELAHPVVALRAALENEEAPLPPGAGVEHAAVSRSAPPRHAIEFTTHASEAALVLTTARPGTPVAVEELASDWLSRLPDELRSRDDAWKAGVLASTVLTGLRSGFFRAI